MGNYRLPDFFIVGAAKSGTTSLWKYLGQHSSIFMTEDIGAKELGYFCHHYGVRKLEDYVSYFKNASSKQLVGESCHAYLSSPESAEWIYRDLPQAKIIIVLRNPIERAYSLYNWMTSHGYENAITFEAALNLEPQRLHDERFKIRNPQGFYMNYLYVHSGLYYEQIKRYFDLFGRESCAVLLFDDLKKDPIGQVRFISNFLGISTFEPVIEVHNESRQVNNVARQFYFRMELPGKLHKYGLSKKIAYRIAERLMEFNISNSKPARMDAVIRERLKTEFQADVMLTGQLINRDLSHWIK